MVDTLPANKSLSLLHAVMPSPEGNIMWQHQIDTCEGAPASPPDGLFFMLDAWHHKHLLSMLRILILPCCLKHLSACQA